MGGRERKDFDYARFYEQQTAIKKRIAHLEDVVFAATISSPELHNQFGGSYLFVITRDQDHKIFVAEAETDHPDRSPLIGIRSYWTYGESFGVSPRKTPPTATEVVDYVTQDLHQPKIVCDGAIINELVETNLAMQVREREFVLHRPYGLVRVHASMRPSKQVQEVNWDRYFDVPKSA